MVFTNFGQMLSLLFESLFFKKILRFTKICEMGGNQGFSMKLHYLAHVFWHKCFL
jgi:hypothetical protein